MSGPPPLWALQARVVELLRMTDWRGRAWGTPALQELAGWYCLKHFGPVWRRRWIENWIRGFRGEPDPYRFGKGGNFVQPIRHAWRHGRAEHDELQEIARRRDAIGEAPLPMPKGS
jgi:hypothetical protein